MISAILNNCAGIGLPCFGWLVNGSNEIVQEQKIAFSTSETPSCYENSTLSDSSTEREQKNLQDSKNVEVNYSEEKVSEVSEIDEVIPAQIYKTPTMKAICETLEIPVEISGLIGEFSDFLSKPMHMSPGRLISASDGRLPWQFTLLDVTLLLKTENLCGLDVEWNGRVRIHHTTEHLDSENFLIVASIEGNTTATLEIPKDFRKEGVIYCTYKGDLEICFIGYFSFDEDEELTFDIEHLHAYNTNARARWLKDLLNYGIHNIIHDWIYEEHYVAFDDDDDVDLEAQKRLIWYYSP